MFRHRYENGEVTSPQISEQAVTEEKIADGAVTSAKIKDETITGADIGAGQVQTDDIADGAVTLAKLGSNVSIVPLQDNAVTTPKIADGAVMTQKIADNAITPDKLDTHAVTSTKLNEGAVTASKIGIGEVTPTKLAAIDSPADGEVPTYNQAQSKLEWKPMASGVTRPLSPQIATDEIADRAVTYDKIENYSVNDEKLSNGAVTEPKIAAQAVTGSAIRDASVGPAKVNAVNAPSDGQVLSYENATSRFKYITPGGAGGMQLTLLPSQPLVFSENSMADVDQLVDLSTQIPATAQAVIVEIQLNAMSVPVGMEQILTVLGRRSGADYGNSTIHFIWQNIVGFNNNSYKECVLATDALRQIRVMIVKNGQFCSTNVWLRGYIE
ncbi:MAG: hypothetical protein WC980_10590 [Candidatus Brocadiia bacterium]